ncbi:hypothetical protein [Mesorhizobium koreense]|uniref:hypothetical protein n=1 Tax=Mesorhizobium koreense TaxID=3074855 RepID=UPI00287BB7D7|nr:hypothetical protein [Mesorhizobium sp. WR6]
MTDFLDDDPQAATYHWLRKERGQNAAREYLAEQLRLLGGIGQIAADILDPNVKALRGRPHGGRLDSLWHEIGQEFERIRNRKGKDGKPTPIGQAYSALADEYGSEKRTIENLVRSYRSEMAAAQAHHQAWQDEFDSLPAEERQAFWDDFERDMAAIKADPAYAQAMSDLQNAIEEEEA